MQVLPTICPTLKGIAYRDDCTWYAYSRENHMTELLLLIATGNEEYYVLEETDSSIY